MLDYNFLKYLDPETIENANEYIEYQFPKNI